MVYEDHLERIFSLKLLLKKILSNFLLMMPLFSSFPIIFFHFPPHMQLVTFHHPFLLFSIIFTNKMPINASCLSKAFSHFHNHLLITSDLHHYVFAQHLAWNTCPMTLFIIFPSLSFITSNFHQGCYRTLPPREDTILLFNDA